MNYFDFDMSNSTNTVVYFDWKTVIYIYVLYLCVHRVHVLMRLYPIDKSLVCLQSERRTSC